MDILNRIKAVNKWKLVSLVMIGIVTFTLVWGHVSFQRHRVPLTEQQQERALEVAKDAIADELKGNYTIHADRTGMEINGGFWEDKRIARVFFVSDNSSFIVVVDMDEWKAVSITENRDWMARPSKRSPPRIIGRGP